MHLFLTSSIVVVLHVGKLNVCIFLLFSSRYVSSHMRFSCFSHLNPDVHMWQTTVCQLTENWRLSNFDLKFNWTIRAKKKTVSHSLQTCYTNIQNTVYSSWKIISNSRLSSRLCCNCTYFIVYLSKRRTWCQLFFLKVKLVSTCSLCLCVFVSS